MLAPILLAMLVTHAEVPLAIQATATQQPPASAAQAKPEQPWPPAGVSRPGGGTTSPRLIKEARPQYTPEARAAKIRGVVVMEAVVQKDGTVGDVRVVRSLDTKFGLDQEAVDTVRKWEFAPGKKDGVAVPVLVEIEISFTLR